jgi:hypothetical protein
MNKLKELYESKKEVPFDDIPEGWKESFGAFMDGQTCTMNDSGQFLAYYWDFTYWYNINREAIEREIKIDEVSK